ncbi:hypothetical protein HMPREF9248_0603 [Fannyhessea vaginae PB189-T1-4]|uniref:Uncharacterized protein n=1 Tax=Fannyhessea vaginae PB189-T1-4 TaxID=866774 RepID=A0ABN0AZ63_9ACTN|nr:hypothetical protein HMPREF9248_0603 [Fannyhessea vaginae PB189-T1-4]
MAARAGVCLRSRSRCVPAVLRMFARGCACACFRALGLRREHGIRYTFGL